MQKWEYLIVEVTVYLETGRAGSTKRINQLGEQGWELVATIPDEYGTSASLIFKRPKV